MRGVKYMLNVSQSQINQENIVKIYLNFTAYPFEALLIYQNALLRQTYICFYIISHNSFEDFAPAHTYQGLLRNLHFRGWGGINPENGPLFYVRMIRNSLYPGW